MVWLDRPQIRLIKQQHRLGSDIFSSAGHEEHGLHAVVELVAGREWWYAASFTCYYY
jgi:hypothetical protein